ncbi:MAG: hypothetical protein ABSG64_08910 [Solirubrobacteraceae bacterium]
MVLIGLGFALRVWFLLAWRPALTGYSDSGIYFQDAYQGVWADPLRTVGYGMFLIVLHWITPHLLVVTIVQHLMGLASAVLLFGTVRRIGGPRWLGLIPAGAIALDGDQLFIEHAALSEALYVFLLCTMLYCAVRAWRSAGRAAWGWAAGAGAAAALGVWDRGAGVAMLPLIPLWLLLCRRRPTRRTVVLAAVSLVAGIGLVEVYIEWRHLDSGLSGLTTNGNWNLYGRVAPWADCTKFTPPPGTAGLCVATPPSQRGPDNSAAYYIFTSLWPAQKLFGPAYEVSPNKHAMALLWSFSIAAIEGQPLDYLNAVWQDTIRLVDPNHPSYGNGSATQLINFLLSGNPDEQSGGPNEFVSYWQNLEYPHAATYHGDITPLLDWEQVTRLQGALMVILLLAMLAAPWAVRGEARSGARLLVVATLALLFFPILTTGYDYRYVIPALGPLFAVGALAGWGIAGRIADRRPAARAAA